MITKLPRWVEYGAFLLALLAGTVNAIGLLGFQHQAVSHISGTVTLIGTSIEAFDPQTGHLFLILISFLFGSVLSGVFIESTALRFGRRYGIALCVEGLLLFNAYWLLEQNHQSGQYLASAACGLQNAMITTFSGAIVRTTHMTGIITDLGLMIGAKLRGESFDYRKAKLFMFIFCGFLLGGILGAKLYVTIAITALIVPACLAFVLAITYWRFIANHHTHK
ncbi:membrane protein [Vibrio galatheae]|uniref:Membrane protein n=1 Tax=Vibrio galatheae TaxID=579748 RepID=A0A0F4NLC5_9VIBR|nr:YoaK family protein [Vibrio galatheae]KJY82851.1 membrane protein [Vibrio galatheae]